MKIRHCPQCQQHSLVSTGAFWACGVCRYAVTQAALLFDQADSLMKNRRGATDSQTGDHQTL